MQQYSQFFTTIHDEDRPVGTLGRGTHYSIARVVRPSRSSPRFHDFAIVWDEDHDLRVIWIVEQLIAVGTTLDEVVAIGERKGSITVLTREQPSGKLESEMDEILARLPSDSFGLTLERLDEATGMIINADNSKVRAYLAGIDALWNLGGKPAVFDTEPYRIP